MATLPPSYAPRQATTQQVNYIRKTVNYNDANIGSAYLFGAIPLNSFILSVDVEVITAFNAATTNVLTFGTTLTNSNELFNSTDLASANTTGEFSATRGKGRSLTQTATAAQAGQGGGASIVTAEGGIGLFAKYAQTGTAATTGKATVVIAYIPDNDG